MPKKNLLQDRWVLAYYLSYDNNLSHCTPIILEQLEVGVKDTNTAGTLTLISSDALRYEIAQNVQAVRKEHAQAILAKAQISVQIDSSVEQRSAIFIERGVKAMDAVHVALAEAAAADYFCSCDDRLLRKLTTMKDLTVTPISPLALIEELHL